MVRMCRAVSYYFIPIGVELEWSYSICQSMEQLENIRSKQEYVKLQAFLGDLH